MAREDKARGKDAGLRRKAVVLSCVLAVIALFVGALFGDNGVFHLVEQRRRVGALEQEIASLEAENVRLAAEIRALKTDPLAIERRAREELGLARAGETIFLLPDGRGGGSR